MTFNIDFFEIFLPYWELMNILDAGQHPLLLFLQKWLVSQHWYWAWDTFSTILHNITCWSFSESETDELAAKVNNYQKLAFVVCVVCNWQLLMVIGVIQSTVKSDNMSCSCCDSKLGTDRMWKIDVSWSSTESHTFRTPLLLSFTTFNKTFMMIQSV